MANAPAASAAERMHSLRQGGRRTAAHAVATAAAEFEYGLQAIPGLAEDLFSSRLSLSDLEAVAAILVDHARQPATQELPKENVTTPTYNRLHRSISTRPCSLWKFNVKAKNLSICINESLFADNKQHNLVRGDLILMQLIKSSGTDPHRRITHCLEFDRYEADVTERSRRLWGEHFLYLLHGRIHALTEPFSLEDLALSKSYSTQGKISPERIADSDEHAVLDAIGSLN